MSAVCFLHFNDSNSTYPSTWKGAEQGRLENSAPNRIPGSAHDFVDLKTCEKTASEWIARLHIYSKRFCQPFHFHPILHRVSNWGWGGGRGDRDRVRRRGKTTEIRLIGTHSATPALKKSTTRHITLLVIVPRLFFFFFSLLCVFKVINFLP